MSFTSPRLASIEEAQRETQQAAKRQQFLRFARRKWLASDRAAESVQRVFRGYAGRKKANLTAEVRRIMRETSAEWVEVSKIKVVMVTAERRVTWTNRVALSFFFALSSREGLP